MRFPKPKSGQYDFRRDLVRKHKLVPLLEQYLAKEVTGFKFEYEPKAHDDAWHPSGHCLPKVSTLWQMAKDHLDDVPSEEKRSSLNKAFLVGHFWHALLQHAVVELGLAEPSAIERRGMRGWGAQVPERQVGWGSTTFQPYHWATGSGDVAPVVLSSGEFLLDFKTMSSHQYKANSLPEWAAGKYEAQINIYMDWFDLERGIILCINKDASHDMKEYEFERNEELIAAIYERWEFVSECLTQGESPTTWEEDGEHSDDVYFDVHDLIKGPIS